MHELSEQEIRAELVRLLSEFDSICNKNGITYYLAYGSMLGAVRHKGFIPWDNDIDVFIFRNQVNKLVECLRDNERYGIGSRKFCGSSVDYRIYFHDKLTVDDERINRGYGILLDGFILDSIPSNMFINCKRLFYERIIQLKMLKVQQTRVWYKNCIIRILQLFASCITIAEAETKLLNILEDNRIKSKGVYTMTTPYGIRRYPKEVFADRALLEYEKELRPVPIGYRTFLKMTYGDYMTLPPESERNKSIGRVWSINE